MAIFGIALEATRNGREARRGARPSYGSCSAPGRTVRLVMEEAVSLRDAVFWLNIHLDLLAANQRALRRMHDLVAVSSNLPGDYEPDFQLLSGEADRLLARVVAWEEVVDGSNRAARLRPVLAGFGLRDG